MMWHFIKVNVGHIVTILAVLGAVWTGGAWAQDINNRLDYLELNRQKQERVAEQVSDISIQQQLMLQAANQAAKDRDEIKSLLGTINRRLIGNGSSQ